MSFEPREFLRHILAEADYLIGQSRNLDASTFAADETLRRAFVRSLEIIGEAAKKVPEEWTTTSFGTWSPTRCPNSSAKSSTSCGRRATVSSADSTTRLHQRKFNNCPTSQKYYYVPKVWLNRMAACCSFVVPRPRFKPAGAFPQAMLKPTRARRRLQRARLWKRRDFRYVLRAWSTPTSSMITLRVMGSSWCTPARRPGEPCFPLPRLAKLACSRATLYQRIWREVATVPPSLRGR